MKKSKPVNKHFEYNRSMKKPSTDFVNGKIEFVNKYLNRPIAGIIVKMVYNTRISPDHITYFSFFVGLLGAFFYSLGEYRYFIIGGILFQSSSIIDGADGMLARSRGEISRFGSYLDLMFDRILDFFNLAALSIGSASYFNSSILLFLGLLGSGFYLLQVNIFYLIKSYLRSEEKGDTGESRAVMIFLIFLFSVFNRLDICIYIGLAVTLTVNILRIIQFLRFGIKKS